MIILLMSGMVVFTILRLIMSSNKFIYWGNVLSYAILSSLRNLIPGFSFGFFDSSMNRYLNTFITTFIIGIPLIYLLRIIDDRGSAKTFSVAGMVSEVVCLMIIAWIVDMVFY